eukprot:gene3884-4847_t
MPLEVDNSSELRDAKYKIFGGSNTKQTGWILVNYVSESKLHFAAQGEGGVAEIKPHLLDDQIQYILIRTPEYRILVTSTGSKVPQSESSLKKPHIFEVKKFLQLHDHTLTLNDKSIFSDDTLKKAIKENYTTILK